MIVKQCRNVYSNCQGVDFLLVFKKNIIPSLSHNGDYSKTVKAP